MLFFNFIPKINAYPYSVSLYINSYSLLRDSTGSNLAALFAGNNQDIVLITMLTATPNIP